MARKRTKKTEPEEKSVTLEVRRMKLEDLEPHPKNQNIRRHPAPGTPKWETLKKSLQRDYFDPIVWNEENGKLVSGHLRTKVLMEDEVIYADVVVVHYDEGEHMARMLAANKSVGEDDPEGQKEFLRELGEIEELDLDWTGFSMPELEDMNIFPDPEFDFSDEDEAVDEYVQDEEFEDEDEVEQGSDRGIKYFQLIYGLDDYQEFQKLLDRYRKANEVDLREEFGDEWKDLANVCLHLLRQNA